MDAMSEYSDSNDSEYEPPESFHEEEVSSEEQQSRSLRNRRSVDYAKNAVDDFFEGRPGYTNFGRTRTRRPRSAGTDNKVTKEAPATCTLLNFFTVNDTLLSNTPPKPKSKTKRKAKPAAPPKYRGRNRVGRPKKLSDGREQRVQQLAKRLKTSCASASLATAPVSRRKWNGSVI